MTSARGSSARLDTLSDVAAEVRRDSWTMPGMPGESVRSRPRAVPAREELGGVIADFVYDAQTGDARDSAGDPYTREGLREMRSALTHVDSELGGLSVDAISGRDVQDMLDGVRAAGLPPRRVNAIVMALHALYAYAIEKGIVDRSPLPGPVAPAAPAARVAPVTSVDPITPIAPDFRPGPPPVPLARPTARTGEQRTPTIEMLAAARRVVGWTVTTIVVLFVLLLIVLLQQL
ncbi:MAG: hypothetical protein QOJ12_1311 [Thermoleophilales bacterium]|nr:hypothetical protein [Thermoleophilales bacterium]